MPAQTRVIRAQSVAHNAGRERLQDAAKHDAVPQALAEALVRPRVEVVARRARDPHAQGLAARSRAGGRHISLEALEVARGGGGAHAGVESRRGRRRCRRAPSVHASFERETTGGSTRRDVGRRLGDALEVPSRVPRNRRSGRGATSLETRRAPGARLPTSTRARGARPLFGASAVARAGCARSRRGLSRRPPSSTKRLMMTDEV